jgi:hypothetical protein
VERNTGPASSTDNRAGGKLGWERVGDHYIFTMGIGGERKVQITTPDQSCPTTLRPCIRLFCGYNGITDEESSVFNDKWIHASDIIISCTQIVSWCVIRGAPPSMSRRKHSRPLLGYAAFRQGAIINSVKWSIGTKTLQPYPLLFLKEKNNSISPHTRCLVLYNGVFWLTEHNRDY